jgi:hypothetical protein
MVAESNELLFGDTVGKTFYYSVLPPATPISTQDVPEGSTEAR